MAIDDHNTTTDELPMDATARREAIAKQFDHYRARVDALIEDDPGDCLGPSPEETEPPRQPLLRPSIRLALVQALDLSNAWATPPEAARELASVFQTSLVGLMRLDVRYIPWVVALMGQVNTYVAEAVAALAPPTSIKH